MKNNEMVNTYNAVTISVIKTSNYPLLPNPTAEYKQYFSLPTIGDYNLISIKNCDDDDEKQELFKVLKNFSQQSLNNNLSDIISKHTFYAIKNKLTNYNIFEGNNKNFTFVSMIHFNYRKMIKDNKTRDQIIGEIYSAITAFSEKIKLSENDLVIYDSLDSFEIVLIFRISNYRAGAELIKNIDAMDYVIYSYSLFGYDKQRINMIDEFADKITICAVVNNQKAFEDWLDTLRQHCKKYTNDDNFLQYNRMGNEDIIINIKDYPIKDFLMQLDQGGIFAQDNFQKAFMNVRIHFDDKYNNIKKQNELSDTYIISLKESYLKAVEQNKNVKVRPEIHAAIVEVLNSCDKLFSHNFADDVYVCLWNVFDEFIKRVATFKGKNSKEEGTTSLVMYNESINRFKNSIMSIITGSLHSDRMFFQSPGFNAVLYNIPSKLIVFYTSFVNKVAKILKNGNESFSFIISPDLYLNTSVSELFDEEGFSPICKIRTSVNSLFLPQSLLTSMTHEVAHYVGSETRLRKERLEYEIRIIASKFTSRILKEVKDDTYKKIMLLTNKSDLKQVKLDVYNTVYKTIADKITGSINRQIKYKSIYMNNGLVYYQKNTKEMLIKSVYSIFDDNDGLPYTLIDVLLKRERNDDLEVSSFIDLQYELTYTILKSARRASNLTKQTVAKIHFLMKESYADLVMVYLLKLSMDEYLETFLYVDVDSQPVTEKEITGFLHNQLLIERIISVCKANKWNINNASGNDTYYKTIRKFYNGALSLQLDMSCIDINVKYLSECLQKLDQTIDKEDLKEISELFISLKQDEVRRAVEVVYSNVNELRTIKG